MMKKGSQQALRPQEPPEQQHTELLAYYKGRVGEYHWHGEGVLKEGLP